MVTEEEYGTYFGGTAPCDFTRLQYVSVKLIKGILTSDAPVTGDDCYEDYQKSIMEQMNYLNDNPELLSKSGQGYKLGRFSEGTGSNSDPDVNETNKRISPLTYSILLDCDLLYAGLC